MNDPVSEKKKATSTWRMFGSPDTPERRRDERDDRRRNLMRRVLGDRRRRPMRSIRSLLKL